MTQKIRGVNNQHKQAAGQSKLNSYLSRQKTKTPVDYSGMAKLLGFSGGQPRTQSFANNHMSPGLQQAYGSANQIRQDFQGIRSQAEQGVTPSMASDANQQYMGNLAQSGINNDYAASLMGRERTGGQVGAAQSVADRNRQALMGRGGSGNGMSYNDVMSGIGNAVAQQNNGTAAEILGMNQRPTGQAGGQGMASIPSSYQPSLAEQLGHLSGQGSPVEGMNAEHGKYASGNATPLGTRSEVNPDGSIKMVGSTPGTSESPMARFLRKTNTKEHT
jgi:hypothetical protein